MWKVMPHVLGDAHAFPNKVFAPYCRAHSKVNHLPGFHACIITNCYKKRVAVRQERIRMYKCWEYTYPRRWPCYIWNTEELIDFLQQNHLLASNMVCSNCGTAMVPRQKSDVSDGCIFCCCSCKTTKSLRAGSFISNSELSLQQWLVLLYWWVCEYPMTYVAEEPRIGRDTAIDTSWLVV